MSAIPIDLVEIIHEELRGEPRTPSGNLYCSTDLTGSLRHAMLRAAGAPQLEREVVDYVATSYGTFWHKLLHDALTKRGVPFMQEVRLDPWLPEGWAGVADWVFWHPKYEAFVLGDLKTAKGEGMKFIRDEGAKRDHVLQISAYWYALRNMGLPLLKQAAVLYLPKNDTQDKQEEIEPILVEFEPVSEDSLLSTMYSRAEAVWAYLSTMDDDLLTVSQRRSLYSHPDIRGNMTLEDVYVTDLLAPVQDRVQKCWWDKKAGVWNVKLVPHWSAVYCPFPTQLCDCREQGSTKIGHWSLMEIDYGDVPHTGPTHDVAYFPRRGYEDVEPEVQPDKKEVAKRMKELNARD